MDRNRSYRLFALRYPAFLGETRILNLQVANAEVDLLLTRNNHDVAVKVLRREGDVRIMVLM